MSSPAHMYHTRVRGCNNTRTHSLQGQTFYRIHRSAAWNAVMILRVLMLLVGKVLVICGCGPTTQIITVLPCTKPYVDFTPNQQCEGSLWGINPLPPPSQSSCDSHHCFNNLLGPPYLCVPPLQLPHVPRKLLMMGPALLLNLPEHTMQTDPRTFVFLA